MTTRGATLAALLAVLGRPAWWVLALAGFLARGGIVLFLLAIITLPSPLALSNVVAPLLVPLVFGGVTPVLAALIAAGILVVIAWIVVGGWIGAATEVGLVLDGRRAASDEGVPNVPAAAAGRWLISRVAIARLIAHVPLAIAIGLGSVQIVNVAYAELTTPFDVLTPLPIRIVTGAVGPILAIVVAWLIGEIAGGLAARRIVLGGHSLLHAVAGGYSDLVVHPGSALAPALLTAAVLAIDVAATLAVVELAWTAARSQLVEIPANGLGIGLSIASFAAAWCLALVVVGLVDAWRSAAMTFEAERAAVARLAGITSRTGGSGGVAGTFGAPSNGRPGDWSAGKEGGTL